MRHGRGADPLSPGSYILLPDMLKNAPMFKKAAVAKLVRPASRECVLTHLRQRALTPHALSLVQGGRGAGGRGRGGAAGGRGRVRFALAQDARARSLV